MVEFTNQHSTLQIIRRLDKGLPEGFSLSLMWGPEGQAVPLIDSEGVGVAERKKRG